MNIHIEKLVFGGQGMGRTPDGKVVFVWNALPGEDVEIAITKNKKTHIEAEAVHILTPSPHRMVAREDHFLSCSPWQILAFEEENAWKVRMAQETYTRIGNVTSDISLSIASDAAHQYGYRNKIEYGFTSDSIGRVSFSFFERGEHGRLPIDHCALASDAITYTAATILAWIRKEQIPHHVLERLIVRSNQKGETIASLHVFGEPRCEAPKNLPSCVGFQLWKMPRQRHRHGSKILLLMQGQEILTEQLRGVALAYGSDSFFQINVPVFEQALHDIAVAVDGSETLVDYYSGVGAIGLSLANTVKSCTLIESNTDAARLAEENITRNGIANATVFCSPAEKMVSYITYECVLTLDPPRAGLHERLMRQILSVQPKKIVYLSCNVATHARDIALLQSAYRIKNLKLYNFFPRTPHIEALCVLERKEYICSVPTFLTTDNLFQKKQR